MVKVTAVKEYFLGGDGVGGKMAGKVRALRGDNVRYYIRYDNYNNNAYMNLAY